MKKIKDLIKLVSMTGKTKVIALLIGGVVTVSGIGGVYYWQSSKGNDKEMNIAESINKNDKTKDTDKKINKEEKEKKLKDLKEEIKKIDPNADLNKTEGDIEKDLAYFENVKKEVSKSKEVSKKEDSSDNSSNDSGNVQENQTNNNVTSNNNSNTSNNSGSSSNNSGGGTTNKPVEPSTPPVEPSTPPTKPVEPPTEPVKPVEPPKPTKPSGRRTDLEEKAINDIRQNLTNSTEIWSQEVLDMLNNYGEQFYAGNISADEIKSRMMGYEFKLDGSDWTIDKLSVSKFVNDGESSFIARNIVGTQYLFVRAYYDGNADKTTLWVISATSW